jgi:hypothetical protein
MDRYIDDIATHVTNQLNAAKAKIGKGKKEVQSYVNSLSPSLRKIGKEAIADIQNKFNALSGVFAFIIEIKNTLTNLLSGISDVVMAIIADPIGFFKNLIAGVGQGFANFGANIWTHLKTGFFTWLTGATKGIDLTMPEDIFSLKGIFSIIKQVLGLTWNGIRAIGSRVIGEPVMKVLETSFEMVQIVRKDGVAGLWEHLKDQFADLKATIMDTIMDMIQTQVIQAGIKWIMGLLTPVGAFIKPARAIIDVVKFFIQRAAQIMELIKVFIDSVAAIASGNVSAVAKSIENLLGKAVPVLIGFLASLLGIGRLADKVLGVIRKIRQRIENAIVKFWTFVKGKAGKLLSKIGVRKKEKKEKIATDQRTLAEKEKDLNAGVKDGTRLLKDESFDKKEIQKRLEILEDRYDLQELKIITDKVDTGKETVHIYGKVNPEKDGEKVQRTNKNLPTTIITYSYGRSVANPLTSKKDVGDGTIDIPGWSHAQLLNKKNNVWRRGHMVSEALGGKGSVGINNLSIISQSTNSGMDKRPEQFAKNAINKGKTLIYEATWENHPKKGEIQNFAKWVNVKITEKETGDVKNYPFNNLPEPSENVDDVKFNLNEHGRPTLMKEFGLSETFARELIDDRNKNGNFENFSSIEKRMEKYYLDKGYLKIVINLTIFMTKLIL